jgi:hypothetical protein
MVINRKTLDLLKKLKELAARVDKTVAVISSHYPK